MKFLKEEPLREANQPTNGVTPSINDTTKKLIVNESDLIINSDQDFKATSSLYYKEDWKINSLMYPNQRIENIGKDQVFPVLNLSPVFRTYAEKNQVCLHGFDQKLMCDGHWNSEGHRLAGQKIAQSLCKNIDVYKDKNKQ